MGIYLKGQDLYPAVISLEGSLFAARFVDFPNCVAMGSSVRQAEERAETALSIWLGVRKKMGRPLPPPSTVPSEGRTAHRFITYIPAKLAEAA